MSTELVKFTQRYLDAIPKGLKENQLLDPETEIKVNKILNTKKADKRKIEKLFPLKNITNEQKEVIVASPSKKRKTNNSVSSAGLREELWK
ncbi:3632_t:CDS:2 [Dentiscutata erythropus]|uniref:3632_t:CDS:1 n=1 Tax=Dentiscutata erythropus TaxID=1348616 RepID=A0A9N9I3L7_9GLOM|nr:3632_t:CDS:2 [Dentiscutata erythropus]